MWKRYQLSLIKFRRLFFYIDNFNTALKTPLYSVLCIFSHISLIFFRTTAYFPKKKSMTPFFVGKKMPPFFEEKIYDAHKSIRKNVWSPISGGVQVNNKWSLILWDFWRGGSANLLRPKIENIPAHPPQHMLLTPHWRWPIP